jgi:hypothetical protein
MRFGQQQAVKVLLAKVREMVHRLWLGASDGHESQGKTQGCRKNAGVWTDELLRLDHSISAASSELGLHTSPDPTANRLLNP